MFFYSVTKSPLTRVDLSAYRNFVSEKLIWFKWYFLKVQPFHLYSYIRLDYQSRLTVLVLPEPNSTCTDDGAVMMNGSSWFRADCSRCRCESGLIFCDSQGLPLAGEPNCTPLPPDCTLSRVPPGQCCPVCVSKYDSNIEQDQREGLILVGSSDIFSRFLSRMYTFSPFRLSKKQFLYLSSKIKNCVVP